MRYGSVCTGIAAEAVAWSGLDFEPAFHAEIDRFACALLEQRHAGVPNLGDFTKIGVLDVEPVDLLIGGTPCQSFSVAGGRRGLDDPRGDLALEFVALARRLGARWVVLENVTGLLSSSDGRDFGVILGALAECGYGFAYRVFDTQYVRVDLHPRAIPQRRRRVIVVGYLGDWRPAAAVLLEPEGLRGDHPPRRSSRKDVAPSLANRARGGGGLGTDTELDRGLIVFGGNNTSGPVDVAPACRAKGGTVHGDFESKAFVVAPPLCSSNHYGDQDAREGHLVPSVADPIAANEHRTTSHSGNNPTTHNIIPVAHALPAHSGRSLVCEDGTGRGVPIIPVMASGCGNANSAGVGQEGDPAFALQGGVQQAVAFDTTQVTSPENRSQPQPGGPCHSIPRDGHPPAVAFQTRGSNLDVGGDHTGTLGSNADRASGSAPCLATAASVRRLTPREAERLQGFPDDYTLIDWGRRASIEKIAADVVKYYERTGYTGEALVRACVCPDGPRYKALGNSISTNVLRWVGQRIEIVQRILSTA